MTFISETLIKKTGIALFLLFCFSIFIAKPAVNIVYAWLMLISLIYLIKYGTKDIFTDNRYVLILLFPICVNLKKKAC